MNTNDFLLEIGTEEMPPKLLEQLSIALTNNLVTQLDDFNLQHGKVESFATPRRLSVLVYGLQLQQADQTIQHKGPAVNAPIQAVEGFAKSYGVTKADLTQKALGKTDYYFFNTQKKGVKTTKLLPNIVNTAIKKIPITRTMRWSDLDSSFVRPVHWLIMMLGTQVVNASVMGIKSSNTTQGLRFTGEREFNIKDAKDYQKTLFKKARIEVSFKARKAIIYNQVMGVAAKCQANAVIDEALLAEVCALVECPHAFSGVFDTQFLSIPEEVLISAMQSHQKYFHIVDDSGKLLPTFIAVANIDSNDLSMIVEGNERVIRARLADAQFFWEQDRATSLQLRLPKLDQVLFMHSLGSMGDKAQRIAKLSASVANIIGADINHSGRAGLLAKTDLVTDMVGEFAELQGVMGGYYAKNDGESSAVVNAISEHYRPRFAGDDLPSTKVALAVAIADKMDNIVGIYGAGHKPTGSKDPYALKRSALGLLRMIIEAKLEINLSHLIYESARLYQSNKIVTAGIDDFILDRLYTYYQEKGIDKNIVKAVLASTRNLKNDACDSVYNWHLRIEALSIFMQDDNSIALIEANKRIKNILKDAKFSRVENTKYATKFDKNLFEATARAFSILDKNKNDYKIVIEQCLGLKIVIDKFFDNVMVNDDNLEIRAQRLSLISWVRELFLSVADIAYLSK